MRREPDANAWAGRSDRTPCRKLSDASCQRRVRPEEITTMLQRFADQRGYGAAVAVVRAWLDGSLSC